MVAIVVELFGLFVVVFELGTGCAVLGWAGDKMVVDRRKNSGPYWIAIALHIFIVIGLPLLIWFETVD